MIQLTCAPGTYHKQFVFFTARRLEGFTPEQYHWLGMAKRLECPAWFIRDTSNKFYHARNRPMMAGLLRKAVKKFPGETIFVGSSMGGYGAILFGWACKPSKIIAFTPTPPPTSDIANRTGFPPMEIHVCKNSRWDKVNGKTDIENALAFQKHARIIYHDCKIHNVAQHLREKETLYDILKAA